ncbi:transglutaminase family protein [Micropruina sonneratiae]|uniref:transglutaminase family protein n=1 Tax=Micropruina sonneratiae TaxID=2986940 RepID=UPI0022267E5E|nr:transglutaminase family protein [Micropruina sp. KQZ13P-5]MCW3157121.1 transglutaminase family protein [Micropruina sp. KQZ13P-5]
MTRQIRIVHHTGYSYPEAVAGSYNEVRMTPRSSREQWVLSSRIEIQPSPWVLSYTDYWGTKVNSFEIRERHSRLGVTSTATVEITRPAERAPGTSWEQLREPAFEDRMVEMLTVSEHVDPGDELCDFAAGVAGETSSPAETVFEVVQKIREQVSYVPGVTHVRTRARDVWEAGAGVCQDMVHVAIGALRSVGIPARYVSGYLMPAKEPLIGEARKGESHAWLQYWDGAWMGLDPTNDSAPGESHVEVGIGRDYSDVPPLRGIYSGAGESEMYVDVEMTVLE